MIPKPVERLEKTLARVAREQGLDQERLRRWVSFLALCGVLECAVEKGVIDIYQHPVFRHRSGVDLESHFQVLVPQYLLPRLDIDFHFHQYRGQRPPESVKTE